ncbi:hypothetical protein CYMTET_8854 [Cymbomonas tetramitiformis]|uniref:Vesicle transport protein USE1 n=1 Tax=Cymbomonas tetramitiformis TaxID=36881 RepID=A0AAE0GSW7_9CHLO|nr:hypothetical protein CYMTET_8854 [Cymbomonas tetramitiformis]
MAIRACTSVVSIKRITSRCQKQLEDEDSRDEFRCSAQFHHYVESLQQQIAECSSQADSVGAEDPEVGRLREVVQALADQLVPENKPAYCRMVGRTDHRQLLGLSSNVGGKAPSSASSKAAANRSSLGAATGGELMKRQKHLQDQLTDDMVNLASGLKVNCLALEEELRNASKVMDSTERLVEENVLSAKSVKEKATEQYSRASRGTCWMWLILVAVGLIFTWTFMLIRMFSDKLKP